MAPFAQSPSAVLLDAATERLGFNEGDLFLTADRPSHENKDDWLEKGDWLALGSSVGAEKVFFVSQQPVVVFAKLDDPDEEVCRRFYNRVWSMARPQLLFLARPGELAVYDLGKAPVKRGETLGDNGRLLAKVRKAAEVQQALAQFQREEIESGRIFGDERFEGGTLRADRSLVRDLKTVRQALLKAGLQPKQAHALIGRSIFIRYLEDRQVLVARYFEEIAAKRKEWSKLLAEPLQRPFSEPDMAKLCFPRVLQNKDFTDALFERLAEDFNGDTFPVTDEERAKVKPSHLELLRGLLLGDTGQQQNLFFFAYRFDVIPIELISSIYEEFYNEQQGKEKNHGTHYTPGTLVEFVLSRTLTPEVLERSPRVMDTACGSGIFLVEAFRRLVRHQVGKQDGRRLTPSQLRRILRDQIAGVDINEEAVRVAAFSLYLAFLHYQEPREINDHRRLPNLKWAERNEEDREQHLDILLHANAFKVVDGILGPKASKRFGIGSADVIVGNPPWGYPKKSDQLGTEALRGAIRWCDQNTERTIGDKELSQAFIHLALEFLRDGGKAGMLVSSGVFFKHHKNSRAFRKSWLSRIRLEHIVNFAHVRHVFFRGETRKAEAIAPFASVVFEKNKNPAENRFEYWSAKRTALVENSQAVVMSKGDMHWLSQAECLAYEKLWKIYWWGGHRDEALVRSLERFPKLIDLCRASSVQIFSGFGFVEGQQGRKASGWLSEFKELPAKAFQRYGPLDSQQLKRGPSAVRRTGVRGVYEGTRLLISRGIGQGGTITARLERRPFSFRHSILGVRLVGLESWQEKTLLGIFWSSLARYYLFMTSGSWGMWHDEIYQDSVEAMPIRLPDRKDARVVRAVEMLQRLDPAIIFNRGTPDARTELRDLEQELDRAIFDLYDLNRAERELVQDMCEVGLEFFYLRQNSKAVKPVLLPAKKWETQAQASVPASELTAYLETFLQIWNKELERGSELSWQIISPTPRSTLLAVLFFTRSDGKPAIPFGSNEETAWAEALELLDKHSHQSVGSRRIYADSFVRLLTEDEILLIKRNELRFWTPSAAREDAEATVLQAIHLQEAKRD